MMLKSIAAAAAAALLASAAWAQSTGGSSSSETATTPSAPASAATPGSDTSSSATAGSSDASLPSQCAGMAGTERDDCVKQYGAGQGYYIWQRSDGTWWGRGYNPAGAIGTPTGTVTTNRAVSYNMTAITS